MRPQGPTFWHLDGPVGWRTQIASGVAVGGRTLTLEAQAGGPLSLLEPTGSLGRLVLPRGFALNDAGNLYLLAPDKPWWLKHFDVQKKAFVKLPAVGGVGSEARQFMAPGNIAAAGPNLYVADTGNRRVQVFDGRSLVLRHLWYQADWQPVDVAARNNLVYILDGQNGCVYTHRPGTDRLHCIVSEPDAAGRWTRVVVDRDGRIYLLQPDVPALALYDPTGRYLETVQDAGAVRDHFPSPPLVLVMTDEKNGHFCLPATLQRLCDRHAPQPAAAPELPLAHCPPWASDGLTFDRRGRPRPPLDSTTLTLPRLYQKNGVWISQALDSNLYNCQWHRVQIEVAALPPGSRIIVRTYTSQNPDALAGYDEVRDGDLRYDTGPDGVWTTCHTISAPMQAPADPSPAPNWHDCLVQSREGQYLWLHLELKSDGYVTPAVSGIRLHYPRTSYLTNLPAVFSGDEESRWFLERYLAIAQTTWDGLEEKIEQISRYFDPHTVPEGPFLEYLAEWLALPLEGSWDWTQKRRLLAAAPALYPQRGTVAGLRQYIRVYLQNMIGLSTEAVSEFYPQIVEGYRLRKYLMLNQKTIANLGQGAPLWSPQTVGRLQLGVFAREGEVRLVSTGDPARDLLNEFAHRFQIFVPAAWVRTAAEEQMLHRALDAEKPAHTAYQLHLVEPRLQIGYQSTVSVDTIIGAYPVTRLACVHDDTAPPSRAPSPRLGYDTVLAGSPAAAGIQLKPAAQIGSKTVLA
jgi:phage tail-like protein